MPARSPFHGRRPGSQAANQHVDVDGVVDDSRIGAALGVEAGGGLVEEDRGGRGFESLSAHE